MTSNPLTEAQVTAKNVPHSGANTVPGAHPKTVADPVADKDFRGVKIIGPNDVEIGGDKRPNVNPLKPKADTQDPGPSGEAPAQKAIKINYKGQERTYDEQAAVNMLQQHLSIEENYGPYLALARQFREQGIDPQAGARMIVDAINGQQKPAAAEQPKAPDNKSADTSTNSDGVMSEADADRLTKELFDANGLNPTPEAFARMKKVIQYGEYVEKMAGQLPGLLQDVNGFKQQQAQMTEATARAAVDARASQVADELGLNTEQGFQGFVQWAQEQGKVFPGFQQAMVGSPDAMERAIRLYAATSLGAKAAATAAALETQIGKDLARAGGEMAPAARGAQGGTVGGDPRADFNRQMLNDL